jgi:NADH:ubiquinone oxidoreductase subunit 6 (subunit J)
MKNLRLIILLIVACLFFGIGISIPGTGKPLHIVFVVAGIVVGFIFYVLSFSQVIKKLSGERRILWIILVVCVPMIGNLLYIIIQDTLTRKQIPKSEDLF